MGGPGPQPLSEGEFRGKQRAVFAAAVLLFIVDEKERLLLLSNQRLPGAWNVPSGSLEAGETVLGAALREAREELGQEPALRPLGNFHSFTYLIPSLGPLIDVCYLFAYEGGEIVPGDDEADSTYRWWSLKDVELEEPIIGVPRDQRWLFGRAIELYRLWKDQVAAELQPAEGTHAFAWMPQTTVDPSFE